MKSSIQIWIIFLPCVQSGSPLWTFTSGTFGPFPVTSVTQKSRGWLMMLVWPVVTFSLCSWHDNSTVLQGKVISVLITELTTPSPSNQLKTLQRIWIFRCKFAPRSRVHSSPRNPRHSIKPSALRCIYSAACTAIAFRNEKKNMSCNFSGEVKWPASGIPGIC